MDAAADSEDYDLAASIMENITALKEKIGESD